VGLPVAGEINVPGRLRSYHILRTIRRLGLFERPVRVLEAGCGKGDLAVYLARRCPHWQVVGLELEPEKVERARHVAPTPRSAEHRIPARQPGRSRYLILSSISSLTPDVLEHIEDDVTVIRNFCAPSGPAASSW